MPVIGEREIASGLFGLGGLDCALIYAKQKRGAPVKARLQVTTHEGNGEKVMTNHQRKSAKGHHDVECRAPRCGAQD
jgi:hypothetical protein